MTRNQFIASLAAIPFIGKLFKKKDIPTRGIYSFTSKISSRRTVSYSNMGPYMEFGYTNSPKRGNEVHIAKMNPHSYSMHLVDASGYDVYELEKLCPWQSVNPSDVVNVNGKKYLFQGYPDGHTEITQIED